MPYRHTNVFALTLGLILFTVSPAGSDDAPLRGYTSDEAAQQRSWETKFRALPKPENLREYLKACSAEPHHAGGPGSKKVAEYILSKYQSWGLDAWIEEHEAYMPMPTEKR